MPLLTLKMFFTQLFNFDMLYLNNKMNEPISFEKQKENESLI